MNIIEINRDKYMSQLRKLTLINLMASTPFQTVLQAAAKWAGYYDFQFNNLNYRNHILRSNDEPEMFSLYRSIHEMKFYTSLYSVDQKLIMVIDPMTGSCYIDALFFYDHIDDYQEITYYLQF